jgi:hypothetical protein
VARARQHLIEGGVIDLVEIRQGDALNRRDHHRMLARGSRRRLRHILLRATIAHDAFGIPSFYQLDGNPIPMEVIEAGPPHDRQKAVSDELMQQLSQFDAPLAQAAPASQRSRTCFKPQRKCFGKPLSELTQRHRFCPF